MYLSESPTLPEYTALGPDERIFLDIGWRVATLGLLHHSISFSVKFVAPASAPSAVLCGRTHGLGWSRLEDLLAVFSRQWDEHRSNTSLRSSSVLHASNADFHRKQKLWERPHSELIEISYPASLLESGSGTVDESAAFVTILSSAPSPLVIDTLFTEKRSLSDERRQNGYVLRLHVRSLCLQVVWPRAK